VLTITKLEHIKAKLGKVCFFTKKQTLLDYLVHFLVFSVELSHILEQGKAAANSGRDLILVAESDPSYSSHNI